MSDFDVMDIFKKGFLAGVGAVTMGSEKGKELVDKLVDKGQISVEQGKALNQELKHKLDDAVADSKAKAAADRQTSEAGKAAQKGSKSGDFSDFVSKLTPEQVEALKSALNQPAEETTGSEEAESENHE